MLRKLAYRFVRIFVVHYLSNLATLVVLLLKFFRENYFTFDDNQLLRKSVCSALGCPPAFSAVTTS
ncbi:MAG: hypothetical protein JWR23_1848 [Mucilaginibacter sp.]|nr:hypothetical protein [Mucilaginibacter sp.]